MNTAKQSDSKRSEMIPPWPMNHIQNVGHTLSETAGKMPASIAVACPNAKATKRSGKIVYDKISFARLESRSNQIANGIVSLGIKPGTRMALMVPPGIDFVSCVFGMFKAGVVAILIDPGMGRKNMVQCLSDAKPEGIVGIALAHVARFVFRGKLRLCKTNIVVDKRFWPGCHSAKKFEQLSDQFDPIGVTRTDEAAIIFTTGSTGPPKGVLYRHQTFLEQAEQIRDYFEIAPGSTDVSGFPLFALFNSAMGTTTIFPEMDPTRPAEVHPPNIISAAEEFQADQSFGSPALWNTVSNYCERRNLKIPTVKRVLSAGAPVPPNVLERVKKVIADNGEVYTPYGATESLPVACNSASVVLNETAKITNSGGGTCVGNCFPKMNWKVIEISDDPLQNIEDCSELPRGEIGELIVQGVVVTDQYVTRTDANRDHKIKDGDLFWHRMGDVGYLDDQNRFWFCGRKGHRVITATETLFTIPCEAIINTHPDVYRSALVGHGARGSEIPCLVVEPLEGRWPDDELAFKTEILELAKSSTVTDSIERVFLRKALPVDIRHNSKIFREQLKVWINQQWDKP